MRNLVWLVSIGNAGSDERWRCDIKTGDRLMALALVGVVSLQSMTPLTSR